MSITSPPGGPSWLIAAFRAIAFTAPDATSSNPNLLASRPVSLFTARKSAKLQPDKRTILLEIPGLQPVEQMIIKLDVKSADGVPIRCEIGNTINKVGK